MFLDSYIFFFNDTATTEIYTLSLHDALPIWRVSTPKRRSSPMQASPTGFAGIAVTNDTGTPYVASETATFASAPPKVASRDRKSTRLNSSHANISYAVFCLKKKKNTTYTLT